MLIAGFLIYFLPSIVALTRGHFSAGAIFLLNLLLGWTLIGWIVALVWSATGDTAANYQRYGGPIAGPYAPMAPRRSSGSMWLVLLLIVVAVLAMGRHHGMRGYADFDFPYSHHQGLRL